MEAAGAAIRALGYVAYEMTRIVASLLAAGCLLCAADDRLVFSGKSGPGKGKRIVLISGDEEYRSEQALPQLAKILAGQHGFDCTVLFALDPTTARSIQRGRTIFPDWKRSTRRI